jgi:hypothetical protein
MVESSVPVIVFVLVNVVWSLNPALILAVVTALGIAGFRLSRRQPVRHALNGLMGIGVGALIAWKTGNPVTFYLPGILLSLAYGVAMLISVAVRRPLVGWIWSVVADKGATRWHDLAPLRRTFGWLTVLWATTYLAKVVINLWIYFADWLTEDQKTSVLGIMRIVLGFPPYALLLALTVWAVRRHVAVAAPAVEVEPAPPSGWVADAEDHLAHLILDLGGADEDELVAGLEGVVRSGGDDALPAEDGHQRRVTG